MRYFKLIVDGYLLSVGEGFGGEKIAQDEYNAYITLFSQKPTATEGFRYRLRANNLEWEMVELPEPEPFDENADISDYENALSDLGVQFND